METVADGWRNSRANSCVAYQPRPHDPPTARIAPAQRAAREPAGTLHRHAACSPATHLHTAARSTQYVAVPPSIVSKANPQHARQAVFPRILHRRRFGAMRERIGTTLILRLPAAVHVANPALPASARYQAPRRRGV